MLRQFGDPFRPLEPECKVVQFNTALTPEELKEAGTLISDRPDVQLYVYGRPSRNLDFLYYFPRLRSLHLALFLLEDISGFSHVQGSLEKLTFGDTKKTFSLRFMDALTHLKELFLVGHKKDLTSIQSLVRLHRLGLSGITLHDLSVLLPLKKLRALSIFMGGTTHLELLSEFSELEDLFFMRITKLSDLGVLADLHSLKTLRLDWMRNVTSLPSFSRLSRLTSVTLDTMKGLTDLSPIAAAPALQRLVVQSMPQLSAKDFCCFAGHPQLRELWAYIGKSRANEEIKRMFPGIAR
jgi:internalin A